VNSNEEMNIEQKSDSLSQKSKELNNKNIESFDADNLSEMSLNNDNDNNNNNKEDKLNEDNNNNDNSNDNIDNNDNMNDNNTNNNNNNNNSYNEDEELIVNEDNENINNTQNNKTENNFNEIELTDETKKQDSNKVPIFLENYANEQHYSEPASIHSDNNEMSLTARQREQELKNLFKPQEDDNSNNESNNNNSNDENQNHKTDEDKAKEDAFNNLFNTQNINKSDSQEEQSITNNAQDHGFKVVHDEFEDLEEFEV
jgi:hypothetical protein